MRHRPDHAILWGQMKEVLTKRFWQDVKKIFDEARQETPPVAPNEPAKPSAQPVEKPETPPSSETK